MTRATVLLPLVVLAACSNGGSLHPSASATPSLLHVAGLDTVSGDHPALSVDAGTSSITVTTADLHGSAIRVSTPAGSGQVPALATTSDGTVHLTLGSAPGGGANGPLDVQLSAALDWSLSFGGGESSLHVDARSGHVAAVDLPAGVATVQLDLPSPVGTQTVREGGGSSSVTVTTPKATPVRVHESGGLSSLMIDSAVHSGLGGNQTFDDPGWAAATDKLDVELVGGVSSATVDHRM